MRFFVEIAYNGHHYFGWQKQPNQISVQEKMENIFSILLGETAITGCGRTDTGVHASQYFLHFDTEKELPLNFIDRINKLLPPDIVIYRVVPVVPDAHARFDALKRSYVFYLSFRKDPFQQQTTYYYPYANKPDMGLMQEAAQTLMKYEAFYPFCKTGHDAKTLFCKLSRSEWLPGKDEYSWEYHISSNRFLRGMVRLIVGMCLNVGTGKTSLEELENALSQQTALKRSWTVPPQGLFLNEVEYPDHLFI